MIFYEISWYSVSSRGIYSQMTTGIIWQGTTISRVLSWVVIYLGLLLPTGSSEVCLLIKQLVRLIPYTSCCGQGLPGWVCYHTHRWALTPPFHPYQTKFGGLLSVALALRLLWPSVRWSPASHAARTFLSWLMPPATTCCTLLWL